MTSLHLKDHNKQHAQPFVMDVLQQGLPELQQQQHWEDQVFDTVWSVGRAFGFQAFNQASPQATSSRPAAEGSGVAMNSVQWVPATIFLVSDHLSHMLVRTSMQRCGCFSFNKFLSLKVSEMQHFSENLTYF